MRAGVSLLVLVCVAGCSSSAGPRSTRSGSMSSSFATHYGMDAALIASHVHGCSGVTAESADGLLPGVASAAECTMLGHKVVVYSWTSEAAQKPVSSLNGTAVYSQGVGWSALVTDAAGEDAQKTISERIAADLGGKVVG